jgi:hypothetical protein
VNDVLRAGLFIRDAKILSTSWPDSFRPSRSGEHNAHLSEITGTSPVMTAFEIGYFQAGHIKEARDGA